MFDLVQQRLPDLITVFLGIFLEATPFLLVGVLVSSVLEIVVSEDRLLRWLPRNALVGLLGGVAVGAAAPLCECGTVPIARSCVSKGLPLPAAVGFLLAAPVINPVTVTATYTAFHSNLQILVLRVTLGIAIALAVGGLFLLWPRDEPALRVSRHGDPADSHHHHGHDHGGDQSRANRVPLFARLLDLLHHSASELSSLAVYLIGACLVASLLQVFVPRTQLLSIGQGPLLSVLIMMAVAVILPPAHRSMLSSLWRFRQRLLPALFWPSCSSVQSSTSRAGRSSWACSDREWPCRFWPPQLPRFCWPLFPSTTTCFEHDAFSPNLHCLSSAALCRAGAETLAHRNHRLLRERKDHLDSPAWWLFGSDDRSWRPVAIFRRKR